MPCGIAALKAKLGALESAIVEKFGAHGVLIIQYSDLNRSNSERRKAAQVRRCPMKNSVTPSAPSTDPEPSPAA
jgi:hypothetical protein